VAGRKIWDNFILVQEAIHSSKSWGESCMQIKLDMENAFDRVEHEFLFNVMQKFGFNQEFISWTGSCISNPWITPLLNGRPSPFFRASRGIR
jgi:mannosylglycoprotein endo-beta-mannosidase